MNEQKDVITAYFKSITKNIVLINYRPQNFDVLFKYNFLSFSVNDKEIRKYISLLHYFYKIEKTCNVSITSQLEYGDIYFCVDFYENSDLHSFLKTMNICKILKIGYGFITLYSTNVENYGIDNFIKKFVRQ